MAIERRINSSELDFDQIKANHIQLVILLHIMILIYMS